MKHFFYFFMFITCSMGCYAQDDYTMPIVYIGKISCESNVNESSYNIFKNEVKGGVNDCSRIKLVDASTEAALDAEKERRESGDVMDASSLYDRVKSSGATFIVEATISNVTVERVVPKQSTDKVGKFLDKIGGTDPYYSSKVNWIINVIDVNTGTVKISDSYESIGRCSEEKGKEEAVKDALKSISGKVKGVMNMCVPISGVILKIELLNKKNTKAEKVIIDLGSRKGLDVGNQLTVYVETDIAGEIAQTQIGTLKVTEVLSPNRSMCHVSNGGEKILQAMNNEQKIIINAN